MMEPLIFLEAPLKCHEDGRFHIGATRVLRQGFVAVDTQIVGWTSPSWKIQLGSEGGTQVLWTPSPPARPATGDVAGARLSLQGKDCVWAEIF